MTRNKEVDLGEVAMMEYNLQLFRFKKGSRLRMLARLSRDVDISHVKTQSKQRRRPRRNKKQCNCVLKGIVK